MSHPQIDTDRAGYKVSVGVSPTPAIDRTGIHTLATTDAVQSTDMIGTRQDIAPPIINYNDMKLSPFFRLTIVRSIRSDRLPRAGACQQTSKDT